MRSYIIVLLAAIFLLGLMTTAVGISLSFSAESGGNTVSSSAVYDLDESTSMKEADTLGKGRIYREFTANGLGENSIHISAGANDRRAISRLESSGDFKTSAFAGICEDSALISQGTSLSGSYGNLNYLADSPDNRMVISSGFDGQGNLEADLRVQAGESAAMQGVVKAHGLNILDSDSMAIVGSGDIALSVEGLTNEGQGSFGLNAANLQKGAKSDSSALLTGPAITEGGGNPEAYTLIGYRWNQKDPQLKWVLKNDSYLVGEGLSSSDAIQAIGAASDTWDAATNQNLFADSGLVTANPDVVTEKYNKINTINFKPFPVGSCLAYAKTYYSLSKRVDGYKSALDSDLVFNTKYGWRTDVAKKGYDFQSVALHEIGHTLGLGDLYGKSQFKYDRDQVMHYYTGVKRTLGNGDATGIWELYG